MNRRTFLKGTAGSVAALVVASAYRMDIAAQESAAGGLQFFNAREAATIEALAEQYWPTTEDSIGGRDAGVATYIDRALAAAYQEYQPVYRNGLKWLHAAVAEQHGGASFVDLSEDDQLAFLEATLNAQPAAAATPEAATPVTGTPEALEVEGVPIAPATPAAAPEEPEAGGATLAGGTGPHIETLADFLDVVRIHTMEGLFADPVYGGNRDMAVWKALGYGGAYYVHTEEQQQSFEPLNLPPQSIADV